MWHGPLPDKSGVPVVVSNAPNENRIMNFSDGDLENFGVQFVSKIYQPLAPESS